MCGSLCYTWWITTLTHFHREDIAKQVRRSTQAKNASFNQSRQSSTHDPIRPMFHFHSSCQTKWWNMVECLTRPQCPSCVCHHFPSSNCHFGGVNPLRLSKLQRDAPIWPERFRRLPARLLRAVQALASDALEDPWSQKIGKICWER